MNIDNKFLLVCLQLIIVLLMSMNVEGKQDKCREAGKSSSRKLLTSASPSSTDGAVARVYRLYNIRSGADLSVRDKVTASAKHSDVHGELGLETVMKNDRVRTRIRGICAAKYLCFNHRGRLVAKTQGRARGLKCEFEEKFENGHSRFRSALNPDWFIGFNREGRPLLGSEFEQQRCPLCFQFYKTESTSKDIHPDLLHRNNFNTSGHNLEIGQLPPGLSQDFFLENPFPFVPAKVPQLLPPSSFTPRRHRHGHQQQTLAPQQHHRSDPTAFESSGSSRSRKGLRKSQRKNPRPLYNKHYSTPPPKPLPLLSELLNYDR